MWGKKSMKHEILLSAPPIIRDFLTYNETIKGKSSRSVDEYYLDLRTFLRYIKAVRFDISLEDPGKIDISDIDIDFIKFSL